MKEKVTHTIELCENTIRWTLIAAVALLPLIISPISYDTFDLPKAILLYALTIVAVAGFLARSVFAGEIAIKKRPTNKLLLVFGLVATIATIASPLPLISLIGEYARYENLPTIYSYVLLAFMAGQFMDKKEWLNRLVLASLASFGLMSIYAVMQGLGFDPFLPPAREFMGRSRSTLGNPVFFGGYLAIMIPFFLNYLIDKKELPMAPKAAIGMLLMLGITGAVLSQSRGAWAAIALGVLVLVMLRRKQLTRSIGITLAVGALGVAFTLLILFVAKPDVSSNIVSSLKSRTIAATDFSSGSTEGRIELWKTSIEMISVRPLEGYGPDQMHVWSPPFNTLRSAQLERDAIPDRAHNIFLQVAINYGLPGLLIFLWYAGIIMVVGLRLCKNTDSDLDPTQSFAIGSLSALAGYAVQGFSGIDVIGITAPAWILSGAVIALPHVNNNAKLAIPIRMKWAAQASAAVALMAAAIIILSFRPLLADVHYLNGANYKKYSQFDKAHDSFSKAVSINPYQSQYRRALAVSYISQGSAQKNATLIDNGISVIEDGLRYNFKDFDLILTKAIAYRVYASVANNQEMTDNLELLNKAELYYGLAVGKHPFSVSARRGLLGLYIALQKYEEAIAQAKVILQVDPNDSEVAIYLAQSYEKIGKPGRAKRIYQDLLKKNPKRSDIKAALDALQIPDNIK